MNKKQACDNKHLSIEERKIIQTGIENRCNKVDIARTLGKDPTTIAKEIRKHREFKPRNVSLYPNICVHRKECGTCFKKCEIYKEKTCKLRDRSPSACNKCPKITNCHLDKYFYYATKANQEYLNEFVDSRTGSNITPAKKNKLVKLWYLFLNKDNQFIKYYPHVVKYNNVRKQFIIMLTRESL